MTPTPLTCPRCQSPLTSYQMSHGMIHACAQCGQWLDNEASQRLVLATLPDTAHDLLRPPSPLPTPVATYRITPGEMAIECPECKAALVAYTTDPAQLGVAVRLDVCPSHGTWFDHGEAWTLLQSVSVKRAALDVEVGNDLRDAAWATHERSWRGGLLRRF